MSTNENGNRNGVNHPKPIDHLRAFVASVIEPQSKRETAAPPPEGEQEQRQAFRGRDAAQTNTEDKTLKFILAGGAGVVVLVLLILGLSEEHTKRKRDASAPAIGQAQQASALNSGIVPRTSMQPSPAEKKGKLTAQDLENTVAQTSNAPPQLKASPTAQTLGQIAPFNAESGELWSPKPYNGQQEQNENQQEKAETAALAKPSLVFVANTAGTTPSASVNSVLTPNLDLGAGARLFAHFPSIVTTAIDMSVIAVIDYSYERDGELIVRAGTKAVGHIQQADRSGYLLIKFDRLEMPDKSVIPIDAVATNTNLGPLKGKVTGTHTGRNFLARSFTDIGSSLAMFAGQNNRSGAISEDDLLRARLAQNVGNAGDQQIMQFTLTEHAIVTLPAGTYLYVVFEKTESKLQAGNGGQPAQPTQNLNELRQLLELQREMNRSQVANGASNP